MRGQIIDYTAISGNGLISGDDGARYSFGPGDIGRAQGIRVGARVDFEAQGGAATRIFPITADPNGPYAPGPDLGMWGYFAKCMKMYFNGKGRATRKEYWSFILFRWVFIISFVVLGVVAIFLLSGVANAQSYDSAPGDSAGGAFILISWILGLPFVAPHYAVSARRLHDVGLSGWLALLMLIPYLGGLFMFVIALIPSQNQRNRYDTSIDVGVFY